MSIFTRNTVTRSVLGALLALPWVLGAATTGSCEEYPQTYLTSTADRSITLTKEYFDGTYDADSWVKYVRLTLTKGKPYTIVVTYTSDTMYGAYQYFDVEYPDVRTSSGWDGNGYYYEKYVIAAVDWQYCENSTAYCYLYFYGEQGATAKLNFQQYADIPEGLPDNPKSLSFSDTVQQETLKLTDDHYVSYYATATLEAGKRYCIRTINGTLADSHSLSFDWDPEITNPEWEDWAAGQYDAGYYIMPTQTGLYTFTVSGGSSVDIEYYKMRARSLQEHDSTPLVIGEKTSFVPGFLHGTNDVETVCYDDIVDSKLFSFEASVGDRLQLRTDGALSAITMVLYGPDGGTLLERTASALDDLDCHAAFEASSSGTYYVGIYEHKNSFAGYLTGVPVNVTLTRLNDLTGGRDAFDPADDIPARASALTPRLVADGSANPTNIDSVGHGPHTLSWNDWEDWFSIAARAGITYRIKAATTNIVTSGTWLVAEVFTVSYDYQGNAVKTQVEVPGIWMFSPDEEDYLEFTATENVTYYLRVKAVDWQGNIVDGYDYPEYTVHACAYSANAAQYGVLQVNAFGPAGDSGATWCITSGSGATEPNYPFGSSIFVSGSFDLSFSSVDGFIAPGVTNVTVEAGVTNVVNVFYTDSFDHGDDTLDGAVEIEFANSARTVARTLWRDDPADFFKFSATEGVYYDVAFAEKSGDAVLTMYDSENRPLASGTSSISAVASYGTDWSGRYSLRVFHERAGEGGAYQLSYKSVNVGYVGFENAEYTVSESDEYVELRVTRSASEGAVRVKWGTESVSATAGNDYLSDGGTLEWQPGDSSERTIRVRLVPEVHPEARGSRQFAIRLATYDASEMESGEYRPLLRNDGLAIVTIEDDENDTRVGTVGFTAWGDTATELNVGDEVTVKPGSVVRFRITRRDGANGDLTMIASTEEGTAKSGLDFEPMGNVLSWSSGDSSERMFTVSVAEDAVSGRFFYVTIENYDSSNASLGNSRVKVCIDSNAADVPGVPVGSEGQAANGRFAGVLCDEGQSLERGVLEFANASVDVSDSQLTASLTIGDETYTFEGEVSSRADGTAYSELKHTVVINGMEYTNTVMLALYDRPLATLAERTGISEMAASIFFDAGDGLTATKVTYGGPLFRKNDATVAAVKTALGRYAGRYTVALPGDEPYIGEPKGTGYLTMEVSDSAEVTMSGRLGDDSEFSIGNAFAAFVGDLFVSADEYEPGEVYVPVYWSDGERVLAGQLCLGLDEKGTPVVKCYGNEHDGLLYWFDDRAASTLWHDSGFRFTLTPVGGFYDASIEPSALYFGQDITLRRGAYDMLTDVLDEGQSFVAGYGFDGAGLSFTGDGLVCSSNAMVFSFDSARGVVSGSLELPVSGGDGQGIAVQHYGVIIQHTESAAVTDGFDDLIYGLYVLPSEGWTDSYPYSAWATASERDESESWGFEVSVSFDGNGAVVGVPRRLTGETGTDAYIPAVDLTKMVREGYEFLGWSFLQDEQPMVAGDKFVLPITNSTLTARWTMSVTGVAEALDCADKGFTFMAGGDAPWHPYTGDAKQGDKSVRSGELDGNQSCWMETAVEGAGVLSFWYRTSTEADYDNFTVTIDGEEVLRASGETPWTQFSLDLETAGRHVIRWNYAKDVSGDGGEDLVLLDMLAFGPSVLVTFDPTYGTMEQTEYRYVVGAQFGTMPIPTCSDWSFDVWKDSAGNEYRSTNEVPAGVGGRLTLIASWKELGGEVSFLPNGATSGMPPDAISGLDGEKSPLPGCGTLARNGYAFAGWMDADGQDYPEGYMWTFTRGEKVSLSAKWSLSTEGVAEAFDCPGRKFFADGDAAWYPVADTYHKGTSSVRSGVISDSGSSRLSTVLSGSGRVAFWYRTSCEANYDKLIISVDGTSVGEVSGVGDWTYFEYEITEDKAHLIEWNYQKDGSGSAGQDCVWVDEFSFDPSVVVTFHPDGGTLPAGSETGTFYGNGTYGQLPVPEWELYSFVCWTNAVGAEFYAGTEVNLAVTDLFAKWGPKTWTVSFDLNGAEGSLNPISGRTGETVKLPDPAASGIVKAGYVFSCWQGNDAVYLAGANYMIGTSSEELKAVWSFSSEGVTTALDVDVAKVDLAFVLDGDAPWFAQNVKWSTGGSAMQSGAIGDGGRTTIETYVKGPGNLHFEWSVSSEANYDKLIFEIDDVQVGEISGEVDWTEVSHAFTDDGVHKLKWSYVKDGSGGKGTDAGWLDNLQYRPVATVSFDEDGDGQAESSSRYEIGECLGTLPVPTRETESLEKWVEYGTQDVWDSKSTMPDRDLLLVAVWGPKKYALSYSGNGATAGTVPKTEMQPADAVVALAEPEELQKSGFVFCGWELDGYVYQLGVDYFRVPTQDVEFSAKWSLDNTGYDEALDCPGRLFATDESSVPWTVDGDVHTVGASSLRSGAVQDGVSTCLETWLDGAGEVSFWLKVSTEENWDKLYLIVDGETVNVWSGEVDWTQKTLTLADGHHSICLKYEKDGSGAGGSDCVWIDGFAFRKEATYLKVLYGAGIHSITCEGKSIASGGSITCTNNVIELVVTANDWKTPGTESKYAHTLSNEFARVKTYEVSVLDDVTVSFSAESVPADQLVGADTTPADLGIVSGAFAEADAAELKKVVGWASGHGVSVQSVSGMAFDADGNPAGSLETAYLLNCGTDAETIEQARARFKITAIDGCNVFDIQIAGEYYDDDSYGNGRVSVKAFKDIGCTIEDDAASIEVPSRRFFRAWLVR